MEMWKFNIDCNCVDIDDDVWTFPTFDLFASIGATFNIPLITT